MEENSRQKSCESGDASFTHGAEACTDEGCSICNDGRWEKSRNIYPEPSEPPVP